MKRLAFGIVALMFVASWSSFGVAKEEGVLGKIKGAASEAKEEVTGEKGTAEKAGESVDKAGKKTKNAAEEAKKELTGKKGKGEKLGEKIDEKLDKGE
jgi:outer membrane lipoprotein-sorting protein